MAKKRIGKLHALVTANTEAFTRGMKRAMTSTQQFRSSLGRLGRRVLRVGRTFGALAGIGGVAGIGLLVRRQFELLDSVAKTSDKLSIQVDQLIGLQRAGRLAGLEVRTFNMGLQRMIRRIAEVSQGGGVAQQTLEDMGISAEQLARVPAQERMFALARAFEKVDKSGLDVLRGFKLFDSEGVALINVLRLGEAGLRDVIAETRRMGLTFGRLDLRRIEFANDLMGDIKESIAAGASQIAFNLVPTIDAMANAFGGAGNIARDLRTAMDDVFQVIRTGSIFTLGFLDNAHAALLELRAEFSGLMRSFTFGTTDAGFAAAAREFRESAELLRSGRGGGFLERFMATSMASINRIGDRITRFTGQRTDIPSPVAADQFGIRGPQFALATARQLGLIGGQPRFAMAAANPTVKKLNEMKMNQEEGLRLLRLLWLTVTQRGGLL